MSMWFSSKIKTSNKVTLDESLEPSSFPGLLLLINSSTFKKKYSKGSGKINWRDLCEQMILHATLNLVSKKHVDIEFIEFEDRYLFNVLKFNNSSFKVSIPMSAVNEINIQDHLAHELYGCAYLLANRNEDKKVSLGRVIELLCKRNSDFHEDTNPHKTFVTSVIDKYENFNWIKLTNEKKYWIFSKKKKLIDQEKRNELATELEIFSNRLDRIEEPTIVKLIKTVKNLTLKYL